MAYKIVTTNCTVCAACEDVCPNGAIELRSDMYYVKPELCTECYGQHDLPQCEEVCPIDDTCIIDENYPRYVA